MHITLVHNPQAGDGSHSRPQLTRLLEEQGYRVEYQSIREADFERRLAEPGELVVVAGGDGAVAQVAKALVARAVPIAILPLGTANNVARTLGIDGSVERLIAALPNAARRPFDFGVVQGPGLDARFLEGVGMGLFTEAMCTIQAGEEPEELEEKLARDDRFLRLLSGDFPTQPYAITADGENVSGDYILCEAMNIRSIGPALQLAPEADPADGKLDLVMVGETERARLRDYLAARLAGEDGAPELPTRRAKEIRIADGAGGLRVDDEIARPAGNSAARLFNQGGVVLRAERHALEFLVPL